MSVERNIQHLTQIGTLVSQALDELGYISGLIDDDRVEVAGIALQNAEEQLMTLIEDVEDGVFGELDHYYSE